jgi:pyridoxal phosphate enzyme (YggS family)
MSNIGDNLTLIQNTIQAAIQEADYSPEAVKLIAVTKTVAPESILQAYAWGQRRFGENRVQELVAKAAVLPPDIEWHMIGHLQTNKVKHAVRHSAFIHSVDSLGLLRKINECAGVMKKRQAILLQANISGETTKYGAPLANLEDLLIICLQLPHVDCRGIMTIAPFTATDDELRHLYAQTRKYRDNLEVKHGILLPELSMGMSGDYGIAIREGATFVRIGTAIFGVRDSQ